MRERVWSEKTNPGVESPVPTFRNSERTGNQQEIEKQQCERQGGKCRVSGFKRN